MEFVEHIYDKLKDTNGGKNASYIPILKDVDPNLYGISIYCLDGSQYNIGDYTDEFAIESCSKVFTLALALDKYGVKEVKKRIGNAKLYDSFDSIVAVREARNHTINSFYNGGAIATTSLLFDQNKKHFEQKIIDNMSNFAGRRLRVSRDIFNSEIQNSSHNLSIAYLLNSYGKIHGTNVEQSVEVYTKQCSTMVTCRDVAVMAATLANRGINPKTGKRAVKNVNVPYILNHMRHHGTYGESDDIMNSVGLPIKSGVSGMLMIVVPGLMGIGIVSPPLNKYGNSVKGIKTAKLIAELFAKK
jgi:glutaminase